MNALPYLLEFTFRQIAKAPPPARAQTESNGKRRWLASLCGLTIGWLSAGMQRRLRINLKVRDAADTVPKVTTFRQKHDPKATIFLRIEAEFSPDQDRSACKDRRISA